MSSNNGSATPCVLYFPEVDGWLIDCDVDAHDGQGSMSFTRTIDEAKVFDGGVIEALDYWKRSSTVRPLRDDGQPNRPLTAFSVMPQPLR